MHQLLAADPRYARTAAIIAAFSWLYIDSLPKRSGTGPGFLRNDLDATRGRRLYWALS